LKTTEVRGTEITTAAARLLLLRKPSGGAGALLAFLPRAENEAVLGDIKEALSNVAYVDGKADPTLLKALSDDIPLRRATAVEVLCSNGQAEPRAILQKLLDDPSPAVRFRAALALAQVNDIKAIGTLIGLLGDLQLDDGHTVIDLLCNLAGDKAPKEPPGTDASSRAKCRDAWKAWWDSTEGPGILDEFRKRTLAEGDREKVIGLIASLNDDSFKVREKATDDLKTMGVSIVPLLRQAANDEDPETARRIRDCLEELDKDKSATLSSNLPRLVAVRRPPGAADALLGFVPFAEDEFTRAEIQSALNAVAIVDGKLDPVIAPRLEDKSPFRRAAAAVALCQAPLGSNLAAVRKLLEDKDLGVRMQTALSLAGARYRDAVPVLIALVQELPEGKSSPVEEYLVRLAADKLPAGLPEGENQRAKRREIWEAWWKERGERVALVDRNPPALAQHYLGYTLLVEMQNGQQMGQVSELGVDGKVRWTIAGLNQPMDAQMLPGERVLITESATQMVTERNLRGDILWKKQVNSWPISAQRLPGGTTLIVCRNLIVEVDRGGKEIFTFNRPNNDIMNASKTRNGEYVYLSQQMQQACVVNNAGKEVKTYRVEQLMTNGNDILPNGNVVLAQQWQNRVVEVDPTGKKLWEAQIAQPMSATRLPNGNTLVSSQQWPPKVYELDHKGQVVKELTTQQMVQRARRR
jgi:HEAT repeat protein